jgi:hypothetical protein
MGIGGFRKLYIEQAVGGEWNMTDLTGRTEEQDAVQLVVSTQLRKRGDEKGF